MPTIEWRQSADLVPYPEAVAAMEARVERIRAGAAPELVWLLEHPPLYTAGTSAAADELRQPAAFPFFVSSRGGRTTYHGPGQRVAYVLLDLARRGRDVRAFVAQLEGWLIGALAQLGVEGQRRPGRVGVWVKRAGRPDAKIAAIGVRLRHWVSYHGVSLNVAPDLSHYAGIVPCGISDGDVTSLADLGIAADMEAVDRALRSSFDPAFAASARAA
jgi:lipoyl(octanoyl) transferase